MNKKVLYTLITIVAVFAVNLIHAASVHSIQFPQNKQYTFDKHQSPSKINEFSFISETEDDFRDGKFQSQINNTVNVCNFCFKTLTYHQQLFLNTSSVFENTLYLGVPYYISLGNIRV